MRKSSSFAVLMGLVLLAESMACEAVMPVYGAQARTVQAYTTRGNMLPNMITENFYDGKVTNAEEALIAINSLKDTYRFENIKQELVLRYVHTQDFSGVSDKARKITFYRFDQYFKDERVIGGTVVLAVDADGNVTAFSGNYVPINPRNMVKSISQLGSQNGEGNVLGGGDEPELVIYTLDGSCRHAYEIEKDDRVIYVDAQTGEQISEFFRKKAAAYTGSGKDNKGNVVSFPVEKIDNEQGGYYLLYDKEDTGVKVFDAFYDGNASTPEDNSNVIYIAYDDLTQDVWARGLPAKSDTAYAEEAQKLFYSWEVFSNDNTWDNIEAAITVYNTIRADRKWWNDTLGFEGGVGEDKPKEIYVVLNYPNDQPVRSQYSASLREWLDKGYYPPYDNACFDPNYDDALLLCIGNYRNYFEASDVLGHEFTHAMTSEIAKLIYYTESGAIDEAYADVMGELFSNTRLETIGETLIGYKGSPAGCMRSLIDPSVSDNNPVKYSQCNFDIKDDSGRIHNNSAIIEHAIYLLEQKLWDRYDESQKADGGYIKETSDALARLVFNSLWYLCPDASFTECRLALCQAARDQGWDDEAVGLIGQAMDEVEVYSPETVTVKLSSETEAEQDKEPDNEQESSGKVSENTIFETPGVQIGNETYTLRYDSAELVYTGSNLKKKLQSILKLYDRDGKEVQVASVGVKKLKDVNGGGTLVKIKLAGMKPCKLASPVPLVVTPYTVRPESVLDDSRAEIRVRILNALGKKKTLKLKKGDYEFDSEINMISFKGNYAGSVKKKS